MNKEKDWKLCIFCDKAHFFYGKAHSRLFYCRLTTEWRQNNSQTAVDMPIKFANVAAIEMECDFQPYFSLFYEHNYGL